MALRPGGEGVWACGYGGRRYAGPWGVACPGRVPPSLPLLVHTGQAGMMGDLPESCWSAPSSPNPGF